MMLISRIRQFFATAKGRDVLLYLIFVVVSFAFWMILTLGNSLQSNITVRLKIEGMPKGVTLVGDCPEHIVVSVKTNGYAFLRQMLNVEPELSLDFAKYDNRNGYLIVSHQQLQEQLVGLLGQEATINSFSPDGFSSYYTKLPPKKVPVHIVGDFAAGMQYVINGDITVEPHIVSVYSGEDNLNAIDFINTNKIIRHNLSDTLKVKVAVSKMTDVKIVPDTVSIVVPVEPLVRKTQDITITSKNCPEGVRIVAFPAIVKVDYLLPLSLYNSPKSEHPVVYVDYNDILQSTRMLPLRVVPSQRFHNVILPTDSVEYITE